MPPGVGFDFPGLTHKTFYRSSPFKPYSGSLCIHSGLAIVSACTGHALISKYAAQFHKELSWCMCSHLHKSVIHIIHICPLHMRSPPPGNHYQLVEFVKFLKKNPWAFEWPGVDLVQSDGRGKGTPSGRGEVTGVSMNLCCWAKLPIESAGGVPLVGVDPHPCIMLGQHSECTSFLVCMLLFSFTRGHSSLGWGGKIPISLTFIFSSSELVGTY